MIPIVNIVEKRMQNTTPIIHVNRLILFLGINTTEYKSYMGINNPHITIMRQLLNHMDTTNLYPAGI